MKLTFQTADGRQVTAEADDADIVHVEVQQGDDEFVMLRFRARSLSVTAPEDAGRYLRFNGPVT